ncbi:MAG TPA: amidohydrolase family protein [Myxococcota bacterium]|nr:amidohydrolase family protein [Myxococcota bacterium]HOA13712.1 amidohydrolase family protein [Myxococcota bacterium]HOH77381.1 amidohydrolase family protein [Myxococcota bacterium]HPV04170.1 amidohydrolase family protein [Myxococcota bacterium]
MILKIPRCFDHHNHYTLYLALSGCPTLDGISDRGEALGLLAGLPTDRPTLVTGWHSGRLRIGPDDLHGLPPVVIINFSLHGYMMNDAAAGVAERAGFPVVPASAHEAERLMPDVLTFFGGFCPPDAEMAERFVNRMKRIGLYGMEDMLRLPGLKADLPERPDFKIRSWITPDSFYDGCWEGGRLSGFKLFADGALGSGTAAMSSGFGQGWTSVLTHSDRELREKVAWCLDNGPGLAVHAIGDLAIDQILRVLGGVAPTVRPRVRLEHVQFIDFRQAMTAREMGLTLSMQPNFSEDSIAYADRLDGRTLSKNNPFRMLIDDAGFTPGRDLLFGSDGMPHGIAAALQNGLFPAVECQALSIDELLAGYSADLSHGCVQVDIDTQARRVLLVDGGSD